MFWLAFAVLSVPAVAFAAAGDTSSGSLVMQAINLAVNAYIASGVGDLRRRVVRTERRISALEQAHGGIVQ